MIPSAVPLIMYCTVVHDVLQYHVSAWPVPKRVDLKFKKPKIKNNPRAVRKTWRESYFGILL